MSNKPGPSTPKEAVENNLRNHHTRQDLEEIKLCQIEIANLNEQTNNDIFTVKQHFNKLRTPGWVKRSDIINNIPHFWMIVFIRHPKLTSLVEGVEKKWFYYLRNIDVQDNEDIKTGFKINFYFDENPFFVERVLSKAFHHSFDNKPSSSSTHVTWKRKLPPVFLKETDKGRRCMSFFNWFTDHDAPTSDEIANIIRNDVWINPLQYYSAVEVPIVTEDDTNGCSDELESVNDRMECRSDEVISVSDTDSTSSSSVDTDNTIVLIIEHDL